MRLSVSREAKRKVRAKRMNEMGRCEMAGSLLRYEKRSQECTMGGDAVLQLMNDTLSNL